MTEPIDITPAPFTAHLLRSTAFDSRVDAQFRAGKVVRLAPGWYADRITWNQLPPWERVPLVASAQTLASPEICFSGSTATQLLGLPGSVRPTTIHIARTTRSHAGTLRNTFAVAPGHVAHPAPGRFARDLGSVWDGVAVRAGHFNVLPPELAAIQVAIHEPFGLALQVIDMIMRVRSPFRIVRSRLLEVIDAWPVKSQARLARRVVTLADARSGSPMESLLRAIFFLFGFQPPQIQTEFVDSEGHMYVDFYWPDLRLVIEYDGGGKWTDAELATGRAQWERIHAHNRRHDRLLAQPDVSRVVHLVKEDLRNIDAFVTRMTALGIPRDPRWVFGHPTGLQAA
ncbi:MAG: hypothetical protein ACTII7_02150 [Galactobacter sp.]